jgi:16S rRNA (cytidine1402-2'-O)-methyltransferase
MRTKGKLYLIPNTLGGESIHEIIPSKVCEMATSIRVFAVEDVRAARRLLRKIDRQFPIEDAQFVELNKRSSEGNIEKLLQELTSGSDVGVIAEAGCPGIADPGANLVSAAHEAGIEVIPFVGPSSILLALISSGFSGQKFSFHGYLPKERKDRIRAIKDYEGNMRRVGATHIFMDTPFRNMNVLEDLLNELADNTPLCIASNLTLADASVKTMSVKDWRQHTKDLSKKPTMFLIGKCQ